LSPADSILDVQNLSKFFPGGRGTTIHAVNDVSFAIRPGEILGMVGESGSGKSTIGRAIVGLAHATSGQIIFRGQDITGLPEKKFRGLRKDLQIVFQDPWGALNPRLKVRTIVEEPLRLHTQMNATDRRRRVEELAQLVRLNAGLLTRYPNELSGGQLQRVCIARALATNPELIVLDEPTSSLDLSVRAGILRLLLELRTETSIAMLFISHDLGTVRLISDRIVVIYLGRIVEQGPTEQVFKAPAHPYTQALLSAHLPPDPAIDQGRHILEGEIPSSVTLPEGCFFAGRCPVAVEACAHQRPTMVTLDGDHQAACLRIAEGANSIGDAPVLGGPKQVSAQSNTASGRTP
jgi:oligopeptide/dipeptide ABC transporter ATP-binding protein